MWVSVGFACVFKVIFIKKKRKHFFHTKFNYDTLTQDKSMFSHIIPWYIHAWLQSLLLQGPHSFGSSVKQWLKLRYVRRLELVVGCEFSPTWSLECQQRWICRPQCRRPHAWKMPPNLLVGSPGQRNMSWLTWKIPGSVIWKWAGT